MSTLLTNALQFGGPGITSLQNLNSQQLVCHDPTFVDPHIRKEFESGHVQCLALETQRPQDMLAEISQRNLVISSLINNDVHPNYPLDITQVPLQHYQDAFNQLFLFPVELTQLLLPQLTTQAPSSIVFITSARYLQPEPGFSVATSIRSATSTFALSLAKEVAASGIQVNVVAPNFLYSEAYYPKSKFMESAEGRDFISSQVPMGRLGRPEELGELVHFLISGKSNFVTGQIINFTGGWAL